MFKPAHKRSSSKLKPKISRHKGISKLRLGIITLALLFLLIFAGKTFGLITSLSGPFAPIESSKKLYSWNGKGLFNIVVKADKLYLLSYNPFSKDITLLKIPDETYLNVAYGFGLWPAGSVFNLGQAEKPAIGGKLLKETLTNTMGIGVDDYLILNDKSAKKPFLDEITKLKDNPLEIITLLNDSKTDLSLQEIGGLVMAIRGVRSDKIQEIDLADSNLTVSRLLPDGTRVLVFDPIQLDEFLQTELPDNLLKDEELNIGIYNATSHPQLAERAARVISNMGGRVVFTTTSPVKLNESKVLGLSTYTKTRLTEFFIPKCLNSEPFFKKLIQSDESCICKNCDIDTSRADVSIFLGEDYYQKQIQKDSF